MPDARFPDIGELFVGRYRIERVIGTGGFSRVYRALQEDLGRLVAIKVLQPTGQEGLSDDERAAKFAKVARRFEREAKLISRLKDRNTVVMYDSGQTPDGLLYMVLEYVDGVTIGELVNGAGPLTPERVVKVLKQALGSLHEAHANSVLHRDIKPGNIMVYEHVGRSDQVKVLDFGIAKTVESHGDETPENHTVTGDVTADGVLVGTPRYMSPEQIRGKKLTAGSDIYSLGLVAYEMLIGAKAVAADSSLQIIARHLDTDPIALPDSLQLPASLRDVVNKMLQKDPSVRYASCDEVLRDLEDWYVDDRTVPLDEATITGMHVVDESAVLIPPPARTGAAQYLIGAIGALALMVVVMVGLQTIVSSEEGSATAETDIDTQPADGESAAVEDDVEEVSVAEPSPEPAVAVVEPTANETDDTGRADADSAKTSQQTKPAAAADATTGTTPEKAAAAQKTQKDVKKAMASDEIQRRPRGRKPQPAPVRKKPILKPFALDD